MGGLSPKRTECREVGVGGLPVNESTETETTGPLTVDTNGNLTEYATVYRGVSGSVGTERGWVFGSHWLIGVNGS